MSAAHSNLRSTIDSTDEAHRLLLRFSRRDTHYVFTTDDIHTIRSVSTMLSQAARSAAELSGYIEAEIYTRSNLNAKM